jgi:hypothetical protein
MWIYKAENCKQTTDPVELAHKQLVDRRLALENRPLWKQDTAKLETKITYEGGR